MLLFLLPLRLVLVDAVWLEVIPVVVVGAEVAGGLG